MSRKKVSRRERKRRQRRIDDMIWAARETVEAEAKRTEEAMRGPSTEQIEHWRKYSLGSWKR